MAGFKVTTEVPQFRQLPATENEHSDRQQDSQMCWLEQTFDHLVDLFFQS